MKRIYGWRPDKPDSRDYLMALPPLGAVDLPPIIDLRPRCPAIYDQGQLGSCTANALAAAHEFDQMAQQAPKVFTPSRLFVYYNERLLEGHPDEDTGATIRDGCKVIRSAGVCPETQWPYDITRFAERPPPKAYTEALLHQSLKYRRVSQDRDCAMLCQALAAGYPVVFGFQVYSSFESLPKNGLVPMPRRGEKMLGGHAVTAVGYHLAKRVIIVRNSWGAKWGVAGHCYFPFAYLGGKLASDFWTITQVET